MEQQLIDLILKMGAIIRYLDEISSYCEYWLNDGEPNGYVPALESLNTTGQ